MITNAMIEDSKSRSCAAILNDSIRHNNGYPVYITDDFLSAKDIVFEEKLKIYEAEALLKDKDGLSVFFSEDKQAAASDSPCIFLIKNRTKGIEKLIQTISAAHIVTYYQDANFSFKPIISADREEISKAIHEQYQENFSTVSVMNDFVNVICSRANTPPIPTGFKELDTVLGGGLHEGLISIGANTSLGKTTFCMQIADNIAKRGNDVMIFSLEMSKHELISKSISRITYERCRADNKPLSLAKTQLGITDGSRYKHYREDEISLIKSAIKEYTQGIAQGLYIYESVADMTVNQIESIIKNHYERTKRYPVVVIDYLQLLQHEDRYINSNDKLRTDVNITSLKRLSRAYKIPIIVISSFNRTSYSQDDISLAAFKESGGIEYSSDVIIGLKQVTERPIRNTDLSERVIKLSVLKNRQGKKDKHIEYCYCPSFNYYEESEGKAADMTIIR